MCGGGGGIPVVSDIKDTFSDVTGFATKALEPVFEPFSEALQPIFEKSFSNLFTTFRDGCLGLDIDEGRSKMR